VTQQRRRLFGRIQEGIMHLNAFVIIVFAEGGKTMEIRPNGSLGVFEVIHNFILNNSRVEVNKIQKYALKEIHQS